MLAYFNLTKPRISLLFAISGLAAMVVEGSLLSQQRTLWLIVIAIFFVGGGANALNQYFERDIDSRMERTARKRPLPLAQLEPRSALIFALALGILGCVLLFLFGGWLAALLGVATILYYSFYYTLWLKPRTPYNIVIGGVAGAMGPLIGWAAASGTLGWIPLLLFLVIVMWTPPHFWALALYCKEDYRNVGLPMLPIIAGDETTRQQIFYYSLTLLPLSGSIALFEGIGLLYGVSAFLLSAGFLWCAFQLRRQKTERAAKRLFAYSISYLMLLLVALISDQLFS